MKPTERWPDDNTRIAAEAVAKELSAWGTRSALRGSLAPFTTFGIGGTAALLAQPHTLDELRQVAEASKAAGIGLTVVGQGSNLLVADEGVALVVVVLGGEFTQIDRVAGTAGTDLDTDAAIVEAGGAVKLPVLARQTVALGLAGLEWAVGVPGSVGGGVRMNAGGHGSDVAATLLSATVFNTTAENVAAEPTVIPSADLAFGYRRSAIRSGQVVVSARFQLGRGERERGEEALREIVRWRREHQPGGANCGSVFTNPVGDSAGRLIDSAGLKGFRIGGAEVSPKHANFIQADTDASAKDICALIVHIQTVVAERFGVMLHPEVQTLGLPPFDSPSGAPRSL